ncbi:MAG: orotate phosphoribosyltransferase [Chloroflexota bacterium]
MIAAFEQTGAILNGHFQLNSGRHSDRYLEKFNLLQWPEQTEVVCKRMAEGSRDTNPQTIAGPTTGGIILAYEIGRQLGKRGIFAERAEAGGRAFQRDFHLEAGERVLVVDDVLTSGASIRDTIDAVNAAGGVVVGVAVMVDRSQGRANFDVPFFAATEIEMPSYEPSECAQCKAGVPVEVR